MTENKYARKQESKRTKKIERERHSSSQLGAAQEHLDRDGLPPAPSARGARGAFLTPRVANRSHAAPATHAIRHEIRTPPDVRPAVRLARGHQRAERGRRGGRHSSLLAALRGAAFGRGRLAAEVEAQLGGWPATCVLLVDGRERRSAPLGLEGVFFHVDAMPGCGGRRRAGGGGVVVGERWRWGKGGVAACRGRRLLDFFFLVEDELYIVVPIVDFGVDIHVVGGRRE